jgi:DNA-binding transcriptional MerR regulator
VTHTSATTTNESDLLTITEAATLLRTPVATLRYWRHVGTGPRSFRVGRGVRYWRHEALEWLHQQSDGGR